MNRRYIGLHNRAKPQTVGLNRPEAKWLQEVFTGERIKFENGKFRITLAPFETKLFQAR
jgi:hypothetical protein